MMTPKRLAGVAPEVNPRHPLHTGDEVCKRRIHPGFETKARLHQKLKTGVSVAPQKGHILQFFFKKQKLTQTKRE